MFLLDLAYYSSVSAPRLAEQDAYTQPAARQREDRGVRRYMVARCASEYHCGMAKNESAALLPFDSVEALTNYVDTHDAA
ncbi:MAG TPA: hypothetical protein VFZ66_20825 [Herpetosiphonaceae bacterium]